MFDSIKTSFKEEKPLYFILLFGLVIRILYLITYSTLPDWDHLTIDNNYHHNWALSILSGNVTGDTTYFRAPFYIFYLAGIYKLFGVSLLAVRIFSLIPAMISLIFTYKITKQIFSKQIGYIAAVIHAVYPLIFYFEFELLLDSLFLLLMQIAIFYFIRWYDSKSSLHIVISGLFLGIGAITRPTILVILPVLFLTIILIKISFKEKVVSLLLLIFSISLIVLPVTYRNYKKSHEFVLIASQGGINFYIGNNESADGISAALPEPLGMNWRIKQISYLAEQDKKRNLKQSEISDYWMQKGINWIKEHPGDFLKLYIKKLYYSIGNKEISNNRYLDYYFNKVYLLKYNYLSFGMLFGLTLLTVFLTAASNRKVLIIAGIITVYIAVSALFFFSSRFRLPLLPLFISLGSYSLCAIQDLLKRNKSKGFAALLLVIIISLISYIPIFSYPVKSAANSYISNGIYYSSINDNQKALDSFERAYTIDNRLKELNQNIGAVYIRMGMLDSALYYLKHEKELYPQSVLASKNIASVYLTQKVYRQALEEINLAMEKEPYDLMTNQLYLRISNEIDTTYNSQRFLDAVKRASYRTNNNIYLLNEAAAYLSNRQMYTEAEKLLNLAINSTPPPVEIDDESFLHFSKHTPEQWKKQTAYALYQYGYINGIRGEFTKAIEHTNQAIKIDSTISEAYVNLVSGYLSTNQREKAIEVLSLGLSKYPQNQNLLRIRSLLNE